MIIDGDLVNDLFLVAEKFNYYFTNVVKNLVIPKITNHVHLVESPYINLTSKFQVVPLGKEELDKMINSF